MIDRRWTDRLASGTLFARWSELVGPEIAAHVQPEKLRDGELTVRTDTTAWATQLRLLQRQVLGRIAEGLGPQVVRRLRVLAPDAPSWRHGLRTVRGGRGPRDTYG
jgi:predicted nucleic acid-binding Zn ribbon protein